MDFMHSRLKAFPTRIFQNEQMFNAHPDGFSFLRHISISGDVLDVSLNIENVPFLIVCGDRVQCALG